MIYGIGADIVRIDRIGNSLQRFGERFARRILTADEFSEFQVSSRPERLLAKRFAAKEAVVKALGMGFRKGLALNLIGIRHDVLGKPEVVFIGSALEHIRERRIVQSLISISDEQDYSIAFVVLITAGT